MDCVTVDPKEAARHGFTLHCESNLCSIESDMAEAPVTELVGQVRALADPDALGEVDDAGLVDLLTGLEDLKAVAAAAQARAAHRLRALRVAERAASGVPAARRDRGVAAEVALARRESPHAGGRHLGLARALVEEMPHTLAALTSGRLSEWRATILVRETAHLSVEHRGARSTPSCSPTPAA